MLSSLFYFSATLQFEMHKHIHIQYILLTCPTERRCVSSESCLCSSEQCGFPSAVWSSHPNHHPRNGPHNNLSCQCWPSPSWHPLLCLHCLKIKQYQRKQDQDKENFVFELNVWIIVCIISLPSYLCVSSLGVCGCCWKHLSCMSGEYAKWNCTRRKLFFKNVIN